MAAAIVVLVLEGLVALVGLVAAAVGARRCTARRRERAARQRAIDGAIFAENHGKGVFREKGVGARKGDTLRRFPRL